MKHIGVLMQADTDFFYAHFVAFDKKRNKKQKKTV